MQKKHQGRGLIHTLASDERGAPGWNDLMLFRLLCSADRGGQLHNLQSALSSGFFTDEDGYIATKASLPGGLDPARMAVDWHTHSALILDRNPTAESRRVVTANYIASYREDLESVIAVLNELSVSPT